MLKDNIASEFTTKQDDWRIDVEWDEDADCWIISPKISGLWIVLENESRYLIDRCSKDNCKEMIDKLNKCKIICLSLIDLINQSSDDVKVGNREIFYSIPKQASELGHDNENI